MGNTVGRLCDIRLIVDNLEFAYIQRNHHDCLKTVEPLVVLLKAQADWELPSTTPRAKIKALCYNMTFTGLPRSHPYWKSFLGRLKVISWNTGSRKINDSFRLLKHTTFLVKRQQIVARYCDDVDTSEKLEIIIWKGCREEKRKWSKTELWNLQNTSH